MVTPGRIVYHVDKFGRDIAYDMELGNAFSSGIREGGCDAENIPRIKIIKGLWNSDDPSIVLSEGEADRVTEDLIDEITRVFN